MPSKGRMSRRPVSRRAIVGCSLIGFGSSASLLAMAALMNSPLVGVVGIALAILSIADVWQLLRSC
ncbi:MAG: hypothetical protein DRN49_06335 [Thaumarchaeota archaeon]|nr:MAG: hypothetical protein DRN49_06335 [Nitrososphaerota archaeon]